MKTMIDLDIESYYKAMEEGLTGTALAIEKKYGLAGYPPSVVMVGLHAISEGKSPGKAIDEMMEL